MEHWDLGQYLFFIIFGGFYIYLFVKEREAFWVGTILLVFTTLIIEVSGWFALPLLAIFGIMGYRHGTGDIGSFDQDPD